MIEIKHYSDEYYDDVIKLVQNFHLEAVSAYDDFFEIASLNKTIAELKGSQAENAFLLVINEKCEGILFGMEYKSLINEKRIFQEVIWYVNEKFRRHGITLLKTARDLLRAKGINLMIMAVLENSKTEKIKAFYERVGFKAMETHYVAAL